MKPKRSVLIASAIVILLVIGLIAFIARHSLAGTWTGSYTRTASLATVSLILNRNRSGDLMVTPTGQEKILRWQRRGHQVFLYDADARGSGGSAPFATGVVSDRSDVLHLSVASEVVDPGWTGSKAMIVLERQRAR